MPMSNTNKVIAMANTPSLNASIRAVLYLVVAAMVQA